jgi:hypothetical protein
MKYIPLLLFFTLIACSSPERNDNSDNSLATDMGPEEAAQDSLFKAVMAIHDEVMPEMDRIYRLRRRATHLADSLQNQTAVPLPADSLRAIARRLEEADEAMMNWMRSNDFQFEDMSHEEIMQELEAEREKIIIVKETMLNSIKEAEATLTQFDGA